MPNNVFENPFLDVCRDKINKLVSSDLHSKYTNVEGLKNQSPSGLVLMRYCRYRVSQKCL